jgi:hypothetical protein
MEEKREDKAEPRLNKRGLGFLYGMAQPHNGTYSNSNLKACLSALSISDASLCRSHSTQTSNLNYIPELAQLK